MLRLTLILLFILLCAPVVSAQSIWAQRDHHFSMLLIDTSARREGDLLTLLVQENTDVSSRDQRTMGKSSSGGFDFDFAGESTAGSSSASGNVSANSSRDFDGNSQHQIAREFSDRITVQVVKVQRNGNLSIVGSRIQNVGEERRLLRVSGVVRNRDISANNTIASNLVSDLRIEYQGCGPESHFTNQGWFGRVVSRVWPF